MDNKTYLFAVNMGHYNNLEEYNDVKERKRSHDQKYIGYDFNWEWDSYSNRIKFDKMRIRSVNYNKFARFAIAGLVLNRLVSFIDVIYIERKIKSSSFSSNFFGDTEKIKFNISYKF